MIGEWEKEAQMPYDFKLTTIIPASPQEIYDAWLDNLAHSEMTGGEAIMSDVVREPLNSRVGAGRQ
jgi:uncharacterized protein YndB with AHSA1/START domain